MCEDNKDLSQEQQIAAFSNLSRFTRSVYYVDAEMLGQCSCVAAGVLAVDAAIDGVRLAMHLKADKKAAGLYLNDVAAMLQEGLKHYGIEVIITIRQFDIDS